jgi:hypothetical protein
MNRILLYTGAAALWFASVLAVGILLAAFEAPRYVSGCPAYYPEDKPSS